MDKNVQKMNNSWQKWIEIGKNGQKGQKWTKMNKNEQKLTNIDVKLTKIDKNNQNGQNCTKKWTIADRNG